MTDRQTDGRTDKRLSRPYKRRVSVNKRRAGCTEQSKSHKALSSVSKRHKSQVILRLFVYSFINGERHTVIFDLAFDHVLIESVIRIREIHSSMFPISAYCHIHEKCLRCRHTYKSWYLGRVRSCICVYFDLSHAGHQAIEF